MHIHEVECSKYSHIMNFVFFWKSHIRDFADKKVHTYIEVRLYSHFRIKLALDKSDQAKNILNNNRVDILCLVSVNNFKFFFFFIDFVSYISQACQIARFAVYQYARVAVLRVLRRTELKLTIKVKHLLNYVYPWCNMFSGPLIAQTENNKITIQKVSENCKIFFF